MLALLVDGLNLVRRIHAAVPGEAGSDAHRDDVVSSTRRSVARALDNIEPSHALAVFEGEGPSWRHALFPAYKADRPPLPADLAAMLPDIENALAGQGIRPVRVAGFEADDVIATVAVKIAARGGCSIILSTDKSMLSLLRDGVRVRNHFDDRELDAPYVRERFGVPPERLADYLALVGERSQGIPGVRSVGPKTAAALLAEHDGLEAVLSAAPGIAGRAGKALVAGAEDARLSLRLATLRTDVDIGINLREYRCIA